MKKLALFLLALASVTAVNAASITIITNTPAKMVVPPVIDFRQSAAQIPARTVSETLAVNSIRRVGDTVAIVAVAGTTAATTVTNIITVAGGTYYGTNALTGLIVTNVIATVVTTNITVTPLAIPESGLSAADGTVYWLKVPTSRNPVIVQGRFPYGGGSMTLTDSAGGVTMFNTDYQYQLFTGSKAIYATASGTNDFSVNVIEQ